MKATIDELWGTGRQIISHDNNEFDRPTSIPELKKYDNVLVGSRIEGPKSPYEVLIDDNIHLVIPVTLHHPADHSTFYALEVL